VQCQETGCKKVSLHLSDFYFPPEEYLPRFRNPPRNLAEGAEYDDTQLDSYFFFHQPTSFFTIDSRIDRTLRELISESENCLKMNFLVGASACPRKAIYELLKKEQVWSAQPSGRIDYRESIMALNGKFPRVPSEYFDALASIQRMASDQVHEAHGRLGTRDASEHCWNSQRMFCMKCMLFRRSKRIALALLVRC